MKEWKKPEVLDLDVKLTETEADLLGVNCGSGFGPGHGNKPGHGDGNKPGHGNKPGPGGC